MNTSLILKLKVPHGFIVPLVKRYTAQSKILSMSAVKMGIGEVGRMNGIAKMGIGCITKNHVCILCQAEVSYGR